MVSKHVLLPNTQDSSQLGNLPLANLPFIAIGGVKVHMMELKHHGQLSAIFPDILAGFEFGHAAGHFSHRATIVKTQCFRIDLMDIFMDVGPDFFFFLVGEQLLLREAPKDHAETYPFVNRCIAGCSNLSGFTIGASGRPGVLETRFTTSNFSGHQPTRSRLGQGTLLTRNPSVPFSPQNRTVSHISSRTAGVSQFKSG